MDKFLEAAFYDDRVARMLLATTCVPGLEITGKVLARVGACRAVELAVTESDPPIFHADLIGRWRELVTERIDSSALIRAARATTEHGLTFLIPDDPGWPAGLADLGHRAPVGLWVKGDHAALAHGRGQRVAVVGSRAATEPGTAIAGDLSRGLVGRGLQVVSGGAYGIDAAAHQGALVARGATLAVLPTGLDRLYPAGNRTLFDRITEADGLLISEQPPSAGPTRDRFLARNRLLAAISGATVVVEAANRSGAMHAAGQALGLGRPVGAVPGPVMSVTSAGPHRLIREGAARLVVDADDVVRLLEPSQPSTRRQHGLTAVRPAPEPTGSRPSMPGP